MAANSPVPSPPATDERRNGTDADPNATTEGDRNYGNETTADRERLEVTGNDWERVRLHQYTSFPPTGEITTTNESAVEPPSEQNTTTEREPDAVSSQ